MLLGVRWEEVGLARENCRHRTGLAEALEQSPATRLPQRASLSAGLGLPAGGGGLGAPQGRLLLGSPCPRCQDSGFSLCYK